MKIINVFLLITMLGFFAPAFAQVAINTNGDAADATAILDVKGTSGGLLVPRMTEAERDAIGTGSPATGLIIYQTDGTSGFYFYSGSDWVKFTSGAMSLNDLTDARTMDASVFIGGSAGTSNESTGIDNTFVGYASGNYNTTGDYNTAIGKESFYANEEGSQNSALGYRALNKNTTGIRNSGVGFQSLSLNRTGGYNSSVGAYSLFLTNGGSYNTSVGNQSLYSNVTGNNNTASGFGALFSNIANDNTAVGYQASYSNTTGPYNSSFGYQALYSNVVGNYGTAIGYQALYHSTGSSNTATGYKALFNNAAGMQNTAVGHNIMNSNLTGSGNVAMGFETLFLNASGNNNTAIGKYAFYNGNYDNSTAIGYNATITSDNMVKLGNTSVTWIGGQSAWNNTSDGRFKRNVKENVSGLDFIMKLRPVTYTWDINSLNTYMGVKTDETKLAETENETHTGFIAQEVEQSAKETGFDFDGIHKPQNKTDPYSLSYSSFVVPLVKGMQEQQQIIEDLIQQVELLKKEVEILQNK